MLQCPNCGSSIPDPVATFCPNCGARLPSPQPTQAQPGPAPLAYYQPPQPYPQAQPHGHELYYVAIGVLLLLVIILGAVSVIGLSGFARPNRYTLTTPPNQQSIQPPNTFTPSPRQTIWNSCGSSGCTMRASGWREGSVPDTFDYFVSFTSTVPITVYFFTFGQFVQYSICNGDISCVSGYYAYLPAATQQSNSVFKLAEGCADYLAIYVASANGTMNPNIMITQNPANSATGYCSQTGA